MLGAPGCPNPDPTHSNKCGLDPCLTAPFQPLLETVQVAIGSWEEALEGSSCGVFITRQTDGKGLHAAIKAVSQLVPARPWS